MKMWTRLGGTCYLLEYLLRLDHDNETLFQVRVFVHAALHPVRAMPNSQRAQLSDEMSIFWFSMLQLCTERSVCPIVG